MLGPKALHVPQAAILVGLRKAVSGHQYLHILMFKAIYMMQ
jgi:hypothetical protein